MNKKLEKECRYKRCQMCYSKKCYNLRPTGNVGLGGVNPCCKLYIGRNHYIKNITDNLKRFGRKIINDLGF